MLTRASILALISLTLAQAIFFHLVYSPANSTWWDISAVLLSSVVIFALAWSPFTDAVEAVDVDRRPLVWVVRTLVSLALGLVIAAVIPVEPAPRSTHNVEVTAMGQHGVAAKSSEVWVRLTVDGTPEPFAAWKTDGNWVDHNGLAVSTPPKQPATLSWEGEAANAELHFVSHVWSGRVRIVEDGIVRELDLYDPGAPDKAVRLFTAGLTASSLSFPLRTPLQRYVLLIDAFLAGGVVVFLFQLMGAKERIVLKVRKSSEDLGREVVAYASIPAATSAIALMLFYPGIMSSDSQDQWSQLSLHRFNDWHPPLHTLLNAGLRLIWDSPAMIAMCQALALALASSLLIALTRRATLAPRWTGYAGAAALAFFPLTMLLTITLWKDVFYTVSVILMTAGMVAAVCFGFRPLQKPSAFAGCVLVAIACLSFRHNGGPLMLAVCAFVLLLVPAQRRRVASFLVISFVSNMLINGPVMTAVAINRVHIPFTIASHHIAAHVAAGEQPDSIADRQLLGRMGSLHYSCATVDRTIFDKDFHAPVASAASGQLVGMAVRMALASPLVEARHLACVSGLVWRVSTVPGEPLYLTTTALYTANDRVHWLGAEASKNDIVEDSPLGSQAEPLRSMLFVASRDVWWNRPAIFLYLLLFACAVGLHRAPRSWRIAGCIALAATAQSASLNFFNVAQDARYQMPVYVLALALVPSLLWAAREPERRDAVEASVRAA
jgi:hypothetical protein